MPRMDTASGENLCHVAKPWNKKNHGNSRIKIPMQENIFNISKCMCSNTCFQLIKANVSTQSLPF